MAKATEEIMPRSNAIGEHERAVMPQAVVAHATTMPIKDAVEKFGADLSEAEKQMLASLNEGELAALRSVSLKLPGYGLGRLGFFDDNNNNNELEFARPLRARRLG
jgi:hypothetical protein